MIDIMAVISISYIAVDGLNRSYCFMIKLRCRIARFLMYNSSTVAKHTSNHHNSAFYWASKLRKYATKQQNVNFYSLFNNAGSSVKIVKTALRQSSST